MTARLVIRRATRDDVPAMREAAISSYWSNFDQLEPGASQHSGYRDAVVAMFDAETRENWRDSYVAEVDGTVAGYCARRPGIGEIADLWVAAAAQGQGAGAGLIEAHAGDMVAEGIGEMRLETHARNANGIRFYVRQGFRATGTGHFHSKGLGRDVPVVFLVRVLDGATGRSRA